MDITFVFYSGDGVDTVYDSAGCDVPGLLSVNNKGTWSESLRDVAKLR
jgi:hypothetical protein